MVSNRSRYFVDRFHHFIIFCAMHQVCRLDDEVFHSVRYCTFQSLLHVVDALAIAGLNMVNDNLRRKSTPDRPVRISLFARHPQCPFYILDTAVVVGCAKTDHENFVLSDLISVAGIIAGGVAGIKSEVVGTGIFTGDESFLTVCQCVPSLSGRSALRIGVFGALLDIDGINQGRDIVCRR